MAKEETACERHSFTGEGIYTVDTTGRLISFLPESDRVISIQLPYYVTNIAEGAFSGTALQTIIFSESISSVSPTAFEGAEHLKKIKIPDGNHYFKFIGGGLYHISQERQNGEPDLLVWVSHFMKRKFMIAEGTTSIGEWAFSRRTSIREVVIPDSMKNIGAWAFSGCTSLEKVNMPDGITYIGNYAFAGCRELNTADIVIPTSVTYIGKGIFIGLDMNRVVAVKYGDSNGWMYVCDSGESCDVGSETLNRDYCKRAFLMWRKVILTKK